MSTKRIIALVLALVIALSLGACTKAPGKEYNDVPSKDSVDGTVNKNDIEVNENINDDASKDETNENVESEQEEGVPAPKGDAVVNNVTEINPGEHNLDDYQSVKIASGGKYIFTGAISCGMIYVNTVEDVIISLRDVSISNESGPCIYIHNAKSVEIQLSGINTIKSSGQYVDENVDAAIYSDAKTTISGNGTLNIQATLLKGIKCESKLILNGGCYDILSDDDCVNAKKALTVEDGYFYLNSREEKGMKSGTIFTINAGNFEIDACGDGLRAEERMNINGGTINIIHCEEGIESKGSMEINGGDITIHSTDDAINAIVEIRITGGNLHLTADGNDAIDGNDKLIITGGYIYATATSRGEGAIDTAQDGLYISGGTIIGVGCVNSSRNLGDRNIMLVTPGTDERVYKIEILDQDGNVVFTCDIESYQVIRDPDPLDKEEESEKPSNIGNGPTIQKPIIRPPYRWKIPGKRPGLIITPPQPPRIINEILRKTILEMRPEIKPVDTSTKTETITRHQFDNVKIGAASFFITFPGLVDGTYDIYLNGEYNETIVVENKNPNLFQPLLP